MLLLPERDVRAHIKLISPGDGVVAGAGLDFVIFLRVDLYLAESPVQGGVAGCVTYVVLAAQFLRDLVKGVFQFVHLVSDVDDPAPGFIGELLHLAIAGISSEAIETAIGNQQYVTDGVRLLGGFDGLGDLVLAALVFAVGKRIMAFRPTSLASSSCDAR